MFSPELAARLRELRIAGHPRSLTQATIGRALGVSVALISAWEHGRVPQLEYLDAYARLFAGKQATNGTQLRVPEADQMSDGERADYDEIRRELVALRSGAATGSGQTATSPLQFPPGEAITIVCSELPAKLRAKLPNTDALDPDFVESYKYADLDPLIALLPFVQKLNHTSTVKISTSGKLSNDDLSNHLITLGGLDFNALTEEALKFLSAFPVDQLPRYSYEDIGGFVVYDGDRPTTHRPRLVDNGGRKVLAEDVAHFLRTPNPHNHQRTLTSFNGMYSRGSLGSVRALTDPTIGQRNSEYVADRFGDADTYSIVCRVRIFANKIVVPDWTLPDVRLHEWTDAVR